MRKVESFNYGRAILLAGKVSRVGSGIRHHRSGNLEDPRWRAGKRISDLATFRIHALRSAVEMDFAESQDSFEVICLDRATGRD